MEKSLGQRLFEKIDKEVYFDPAVHCPRIIDLFAEGKGIPDFCGEFGISKYTFNGWQLHDCRFKEAVQVGLQIGVAKWSEEARDNLDNKDFNLKAWGQLGKIYFKEANKMYLRVNPKSNPLEHYTQVLDQACNGEFHAAELKQVMEAVNVGLRAHEVLDIQKEVDELKEGLVKMEQRELEHQIANTPAQKEDKVTLDGKVCE